MSFASFLNSLKEQTNNLMTEVKKFKNNSFMEAITAACALVAAADGSIDADEKQKMAGFIKRNESLSIFDMSVVIKSFNKFVEDLEFDHGIGVDSCMKAIRKVTDPEAGQLLVRVACAIGAADGDFDDDEKKTVRCICTELGLSPLKFSL